MSDREFVDYLVRSNNALGERQVIGLAKIAAFCKDQNLHELRQGEIKDQCLHEWQIPNEARFVIPPLWKAVIFKYFIYFLLGFQKGPRVRAPPRQGGIPPVIVPGRQRPARQGLSRLPPVPRHRADPGEPVRRRPVRLRLQVRLPRVGPGGCWWRTGVLPGAGEDKGLQVREVDVFYSVFFMDWLFHPRLSTRRFGSGGPNSQLSWEKVDESQMRFELPAGTLIYAEQVNEVGEKAVPFGIFPRLMGNYFFARFAARVAAAAGWPRSTCWTRPSSAARTLRGWT